MTVIKKQLPVAALFVVAAVLPARGADCGMMQNYFKEWQTASSAFNRETARHNAMKPPPKYDAALCKAAKAALDATTTLSAVVDPACLGDPSAYPSAMKQFDILTKETAKIAGLSCAPGH